MQKKVVGKRPKAPSSSRGESDEKMTKSGENEAKKQKKDETSEVVEKSVKEIDSAEKPISITPEMIMKSIKKIQREIWYTRIALAIFLIINLVYIKLYISDINDTMSMFLQFLMGFETVP